VMPAAWARRSRKWIAPRAELPPTTFESTAFES